MDSCYCSGILSWGRLHGNVCHKKLCECVTGSVIEIKCPRCHTLNHIVKVS